MRRALVDPTREEVGHGGGIPRRKACDAMGRHIHRTRAGFTLLEVLVGGVVLTLGAVGMAGAMLSSLTLQRCEGEAALARVAAERALEELSAVDFDDVYAVYNASTQDDAGLSVPARGANFAVAGLRVRSGDSDGMCGRVSFSTVTTGGVEWLREDVVDAALGMPRDLSGDGVVDGLDHAGDYSILPVRVRVEWSGARGDETFELETILCRRG